MAKAILHRLSEDSDLPMCCIFKLEPRSHVYPIPSLLCNNHLIREVMKLQPHVGVTHVDLDSFVTPGCSENPANSVSQRWLVVEP